LITPGIEFKLANETAPGSGRVMYEVDGTPGAFCILDTPKGIHDPLASVACRELGYVDGVLLLEEYYSTLKHILYRLPRYPDRHAKTYLVSVKCVGNESKVRECSYKLLNNTDNTEDYSWCDYSSCRYTRHFNRAKYACSNRDLSVRCLGKGEQCCYLSCHFYDNR